MAKIPEDLKKELLKNKDHFQFTKYEQEMREINGGIFGLVKKAVGNKIADDQPYTFRINFQNGRIVGETFDPRFSIEKLEGRTPTTEFTMKDDSDTKYYELKHLSTDYDGQIANGDSWVARIKMVNWVIKEVVINQDFDDPEERKLMKDALMRGFKRPEQV
jgi:hypothetical protein|nr:MAG TPA: hypothetical protein [Caudoviricetes sp.]